MSVSVILFPHWQQYEKQRPLQPAACHLATVDAVESLPWMLGCRRNTESQHIISCQLVRSICKSVVVPAAVTSRSSTSRYFCVFSIMSVFQYMFNIIPTFHHVCLPLYRLAIIFTHHYFYSSLCLLTTMSTFHYVYLSPCLLFIIVSTYHCIF